METLHVTADDLRRDLEALLAKAREGAEVIVLQDDQPAVRLSSARVGRTFEEMLALIPRDSDAVMDDSFAADILAGIEAHREPLDTSNWE